MPQRGVGFRLQKGAVLVQTYPNLPPKSQVVDLNAEPWGPTGDSGWGQIPGGPEEAERLFNLRYPNRVAEGHIGRFPQGYSNELGTLNDEALREAYRRWKTNGENILGLLGSPGDWDGIPTQQEWMDFAFSTPRNSDLYTNLLGRDVGRSSPTKPRPTPPPATPPVTTLPIPEPTPPPPAPPPADPLAPFFALVREWPRGLGQRAAVRQFLDWAIINVSGSTAAVDVLAQLEKLVWPDRRIEVVKAFLLYARERLTGSVTPVPMPSPVPTPPPAGEGLTLYRKDGEVYNAASNPRGVVTVPVPRTLRLKKLQVEMDFTRGPHNPKKPTGAIGLLWVHSKGTVRPNNWIGNLNVMPRNLKLQTKVDIAKGTGMELHLLPAILEEGSHHLSFVYDAGGEAKVTIGPHVLSVKSTARNGILEIPKGNLTLEFGHDVVKDSEEGTPESSSPPGWSASNLVVTGSE